MTFALYFVLGILYKAFVDGIKQTIAAIKIKKEIEQKYKQVLRRIRKGKSAFKTRVNSTVYISTTLHEIGEVDVILFLDTKKVAIFRDNNCLYTSDVVAEDLQKEIVTEIETRYAVEIDDVVELLGNKISRGELEDKISEVMKSNSIDQDLEDLSSKLHDLRQYLTDVETVNDEENTYTQEDIDTIFDKISKGGMNSITEEEKKILDDYSNNLN
jgi:hypothetical protein